MLSAVFPLPNLVLGPRENPRMFRKWISQWRREQETVRLLGGHEAVKMLDPSRQWPGQEGNVEVLFLPPGFLHSGWPLKCQKQPCRDRLWERPESQAASVPQPPWSWLPPASRGVRKEVGPSSLSLKWLRLCERPRARDLSQAVPGHWLPGTVRK